MSLNAALSRLNPPSGYEIRPAGPDDTADLFVIRAAITPVDAGQLLVWTQELEEQMDAGGRAWVISAGRRPIGYALIDPLPGLPGVYDLTGGIIPPRQRQGAGTRLLESVITAAGQMGVSQFSCRVEDLSTGAAVFLARRGFYREHEECLLERSGLGDLPLLAADPGSRIITYPRGQAIAEFRRLYDLSFGGTRWAQPYTTDEVEASLAQPEDLMFLERDGAAIGIAWLEPMGDGRGRIEPIGIDRAYQGQGYGRKLLLAALHELRRRGANLVEIGLWRDNAPAMHLYQSLGFREFVNWYYLAYDLPAMD